ncbi:hypothetical protein HPB50_024309 [Hyalomma asiaticum]|uniref:Uncharacterized protein n=1 Tax=Hyalomma asiaticum TaxID=266040 RepID=A0ACB7TQ93_HYAAI|nr:hypothetical protein HPB50_024309 [Hyalomma asiaticum]
MAASALPMPHTSPDLYRNGAPASRQRADPPPQMVKDALGVAAIGLFLSLPVHLHYEEPAQRQSGFTFFGEGSCGAVSFYES